MRKRWIVVVVAAVAAIGSVAYVLFSPVVAQDVCLDGGGSWRKGQCITGELVGLCERQRIPADKRGPREVIVGVSSGNTAFDEKARQVYDTGPGPSEIPRDWTWFAAGEISLLTDTKETEFRAACALLPRRPPLGVTN